MEYLDLKACKDRLTASDISWQDSLLREVLSDSNALAFGYTASVMPKGTNQWAIRAIATAVFDIVCFRLFVFDVPPSIAKRYEDAISFLQNVAQRKISLGDTEHKKPLMAGVQTQRVSHQ